MNRPVAAAGLSVAMVGVALVLAFLLGDTQSVQPAGPGTCAPKPTTVPAIAVPR